MDKNKVLEVTKNTVKHLGKYAGKLMVVGLVAAVTGAGLKFGKDAGQDLVELGMQDFRRGKRFVKEKLAKKLSE